MKNIRIKTVFVKEFFQDESGATAVEYGLIAALVSLGMLSALKLMGNNNSEVFLRVADELDKASEYSALSGS